MPHSALSTENWNGLIIKKPIPWKLLFQLNPVWGRCFSGLKASVLRILSTQLPRLKSNLAPKLTKTLLNVRCTLHGKFGCFNGPLHALPVDVPSAFIQLHADASTFHATNDVYALVCWPYLCQSSLQSSHGPCFSTIAEKLKSPKLGKKKWPYKNRTRMFSKNSNWRPVNESMYSKKSKRTSCSF